MNLREVKQRIQSVKNTQKITSAMKLVSAAKLRRAQSVIDSMSPYKEALHKMLSVALNNCALQESSYTAVRDVKRVAIIAVASDSTLCGAFNSNIIREAKSVVDSFVESGAEVVVFPVGKKIADAVKKFDACKCDLSFVELSATAGYSHVAGVAQKFMGAFKAENYDKVELVYTAYRSASKLLPLQETLLPLAEGCAEEGCGAEVEYIVEPDKKELLNTILPKVIELNLYSMLLASAAAEHSARMIAMQVATDNADDLLSQLVLEYNKGRQQAITSEILDIASGSIGND